MRNIMCFVMLALLAWPGAAHAAWSNDPAVNTKVSQDWSHYVVGAVSTVPDGAGGMFVAWSQAATVGETGLDIQVQRVDSRGVRVWAEDLALTLPNDQWVPEMLPDGMGGAFLVWLDQASPDWNLGMQRVSADGELLWGANGRSLCSATRWQYDPAIAADGAGGFYCTWTDEELVLGDIRAQHVTASGDLSWSADGVPVCTNAERQYDSFVTTAADGGLIVAWEDLRHSTPQATMGNVYAQRLDRQGQPQWALDGVAVQTAYTLGAEALLGDGENGAYVVWHDYVEGVGSRYRAQRIGAAGTPRWAAAGVVVATPLGIGSGLCAALDPAKQLVVAWPDTLRGDHRLWAQKYDGAGAEQWTAGGRLVESSPQVRYLTRIHCDAGGYTWLVIYTGVNVEQVLTLRLGPDGAPSWAQPTLACDAPGSRYPAVLAFDRMGGAFLAWLDSRAEGAAPFAQRVDRWGKLGAQPNLTQVIDVANDQGGYVQATWTKSPLDTPPTAGVNKYRFWREVPAIAAQVAATRGVRMLSAGDDVPEDGAPALLQLASAAGGSEYWEYVGEMLADGRALYSASIATACDSVPGANPSTQFMIEGRRGDGTQWWYSDPMSGTSADNLAPASPASFFAVWSAGQSKLHWPKSAESDFKEYRIYSGDWPNFTPSPSNLVATVSDTGYTHASAHPIGYKIVAVDVHGNASPARWTQPSGTTGVGEALPVAFAFAPVTPNPVRGEATLRFALPSESRVTLAVYDAQGRRVRLLADATLPAGEHAPRWDARDDGGHGLAAGLYFVRLEAGGRMLVRRCVIAP